MGNKNTGKGLMKGFFLVCIGCILIAVGLSLGGQPVRSFRFWPWHGSGFMFMRDIPNERDDTIIKPVNVQEGMIPAGIRNLDINLKAASMEIRYGPNPGYRITDFMTDSLQVFIDGDTLTVEETDWYRKFRFRKGPVKSHLALVLPEGVKLNSGAISIGAGSLYITGIHAGELVIDSGAGSIRGEELYASSAMLRTGAGSLDFSDCIFDDTVIETGAGRVQFSGDLKSRAEISTGAGSVEISLTGSEDDYRIDFSRGIGSVRIGRASYNGIGNGTAGNRDADRHLYISTGIGSVRIRFEE